MSNDNDEVEEPKDHNITFLYTLGEGACPKNFGINVRDAQDCQNSFGLWANAKRISSSFETELTSMYDENGGNGTSSTYTERIKKCKYTNHLLVQICLKFRAEATHLLSQRHPCRTCGSK
jgi:DNA mismatch repair ATPase MutS